MAKKKTSRQLDAEILANLNARRAELEQKLWNTYDRDRQADLRVRLDSVKKQIAALDRSPAPKAPTYPAGAGVWRKLDD